MKRKKLFFAVLLLSAVYLLDAQISIRPQIRYGHGPVIMPEEKSASPSEASTQATTGEEGIMSAYF